MGFSVPKWWQLPQAIEMAGSPGSQPHLGLSKALVVRKKKHCKESAEYSKYEVQFSL